MNTNGIGLGLMISDTIVTKLGGMFNLKSEKDIGSTFTFTVKLKTVDIKTLSF